MVEVFVRDLGPGIPEDRKETLFEKYESLRQVGGPEGRDGGLGLPICRKLVEMNGGTIRVESAPGRGSSILFTLPENAAAGGPATESAR
jgi:signal transduction histidine kinase